MFSQFQPVIHAPPPPPPPLTPQSRPRFNFRQLDTQEPIKIQQQSNQSVDSQIQTIILGTVNSTAYASILDSCTCPELGKQAHAHLTKNGFHGREFVQTKLLEMYGKCGCINDLLKVFDKMPERNLYTYTSAMNVLLDKGFYREASMYLERLLFEDIAFEFFIFPVALKICSGYGGVELGRQLHGMSTKIGVLLHNYVGNALIDMYGKCGSLSDAEKLFYKMSERDCVSWNSMVTACAANGKVFEGLGFLEEMMRESDLMPNFVSWSALIGGFAQNGYEEEAIEMLFKMRDMGLKPNARVLASVLPACARLKNLRLGKEMYGYITRHGFMSSPYIVNGLIDLYWRCGVMASASKVFSKFSVRDKVSFNIMIAGYCEIGDILKAKELFDMMESEEKLRDLISWNSMISGYADNLMFNEALGLFRDLMSSGEIEPDSFTLGSVLNACADIGSLGVGKIIHSYCISRGIQSNPFIGGALVDMYCQGLEPEAAKKAFHQVNEKDAVIWNIFVSGFARCNQIESIQSILDGMRDDGFKPNIYTWNGIIAGYVENGHNELALKVFTGLQTSNSKPDIYTVGIVIPACSRLGSIERGKQVHAYAVRWGFESDVYIRAALIDMYAKCGVMKYAKWVHVGTGNHNLVIQNAMLNAYAMHGHRDDGIAFFRKMLMDGFKPDKVTFLAVLSSCVHAGSVETGQELFRLMGSYGVERSLKHYTCMVDLLSRAGKLKEAHKMVKEMPVRPDSVIWGALLSGCIIHGDVDLGEIAASKLIELEPDNSGIYVMLANLYGSAGKWHELREVRQLMKDGQLHKNPGCSWIEDKDETHVFMAWDKSHKRTKEIYEILENLTSEMRFEQIELQ